MDVDFDGALDGFLSERSDVRKKAADALEKWRMRDPSGLVVMLAKSVIATGINTQSQEITDLPNTPRGNSSAASDIMNFKGRSLAAVLLRQVLIKSVHELVGKDGQSPWSHPCLAELLLEAVVASVQDVELRRHVADVVATAATIQFAFGRGWLELSSLLASWCSSGREERAFVLRMLEQLSDEMETFKPNHTGDDNQDGALVALLVFLEGHENSLRELLQAALIDTADEASRDSAARVYTQCVMGSGMPEVLQEVAKDLAIVLAEAASTPSVSSSVLSAHAARNSLSEACLQAVALAAHADPCTWARLALASHGNSEPTLIAPFVATVADAKCSPEVRGAALSALLELSVAAVATAAGSDDCESDIIADQLASCVAKATASLMSELPSDGTVDMWAERLDEDSGEPHLDSDDGDQSESLLGIALDASERLALLPRCSISADLTCGGGAEGFAAVVCELLARDAWQARHAALLILLRLAFSGQSTVFVIADRMPLSAAANAFAVAFQHLSFAHPRVRWAALEVLARLIAIAPGFLDHETIFLQTGFAQAFETLLSIVSHDAYIRVRRHGLVVLVAAAASPITLFTAPQMAPLFKDVLIPQASCEDEAVRQACANIARYLALEAPSKGIHLGVNGLWEQFCNEAGTVELKDVVDPQIDWPVGWR